MASLMVTVTWNDIVRSSTMGTLFTDGANVLLCQANINDWREHASEVFATSWYRCALMIGLRRSLAEQSAS